ncbi:hypothetical protein Tco_0019257 [Tanacetum coccineum]
MRYGLEKLDWYQSPGYGELGLISRPRLGMSTVPVPYRSRTELVKHAAKKTSGSGANGGASGSAGGVKHTTRGCSYKEFLNYKPRIFDGTEGAVGLTRWFKKMESMFYIYNYAKNCQVKYATCTLLDGALTWRNAYEAIHMAHDLMDQVVRVKVATDADNKRK